LAEKVSRRPATSVKTYGYRKIEFIAAFVNSIVLSVSSLVFWETIKRLTAPMEIPAGDAPGRRLPLPEMAGNASSAEIRRGTST